MKFSEFLKESSKHIGSVGDVIHTLENPEELKLYNTNYTITSLEGCPGIAIFLSVEGSEISDLKGIPKEIYGSCWLGNNRLDNFDGASGVSVGVLLSFTGCRFKSLHNIHLAFNSAERLSFINNPVKSNVLGVLKIHNLHLFQLMTDTEYFNMRTHLIGANFRTASRDIKQAKVQEIINRYLPNNRGNDAVIDCQNELLDAGLDEYAQL